MFKDECVAQIIETFCGLRAKLYAYNMYNENGENGEDERTEKRYKGVRKGVVENIINFHDYEDCFSTKSALVSTSTELFCLALNDRLPLFRRCSCHHFCFGAPFFLLSFIALSSRCVF